ncbi:MAG: L-aspartate oxidase [Dehalococcoidia bacterium]|nr:L-aspartate oxidase [Dehalococcoidia bacterium]
MPHRDLPVVVIGSGAAGLFTALEAARTLPVLVLTRSGAAEANTAWAQGGIAAALGHGDSPLLHLEDTIAAGAGLVDEAAARVLCEEGPARIRELAALGTPFDFAGGTFALGREAAHSANRIVHAGGDRTGARLEQALLAAARAAGVAIQDMAEATAVEVEHGRARGVRIRTSGGATHTIEARAVVIATGGAGQLFSHTTNPEIARGEGLALAFAAGAELADLEFYQFHPTALRFPGVRPFLISEAVRGEGAVLRNAAGEPFMARYHPLADLAPRDIVARAIVTEMQRDGADHVVLDATGVAASIDIVARFPSIASFCRELGIDIRTTPIPVAPAAHYFMGGIRTDTWGRTTVPGLYAAGEAACTGVHGANRLASNSLLETAVFGGRTAAHIASGSHAAADADPHAVAVMPHAIEPPSLTALQALMWEAAGIERNGATMRGARTTLRGWRAGGEGSPSALVAELMLEAALRREESRGAHFRSDFPALDNAHWHRRQVFRRAD